ncbi:MAG: hypothetical protein JST00_25550 [Deltaproteobacteria bacterium]|nr:hypothetical protein [Deltaproteobacteria bacterium]
MARTLPLVLKLPRRALARRDAVRLLVSRRAGRGDHRTTELVSVFEFKDEELAFARALAERTNLWLYRVNQRAFAGDFVVVDVSSPDLSRRPAVALDLKRGGRIREDRAGIQMQRTDRAIAALVDAGVVASTCIPVHLVGDARAVLAAIDRVLARARSRKTHARRVS